MRRWSPDLVLVDLITPRMHGWDFARAIRTERTAARRPLRVVLMTAAGPPAQRAAWDAAPDEVLPKPLDIDDVLAVVHSLLHARAA